VIRPREGIRRRNPILTTESLAAAAQTCEPAQVSSQTVFVSGRVLTGDPARPRAHALAVSDGLVTAFDTDAVELIDGSVEVVDLAGGSLVPSFRDGHIHPLWGGVDLGLAPIAAATSVDELLQQVGDYAAANPDREWITGGGFNHALQTDGLYDAELLDKVVPDRPVLLMTNDYHAAWCNSLALERAGITAGTVDPSAARCSAAATVRRSGRCSSRPCTSSRTSSPRRRRRIGWTAWGARCASWPRPASPGRRRRRSSRPTWLPT
jgi:hypothetical protein